MAINPSRPVEPENRVFDREDALKRMRHDPEILHEMLQLFLADHGDLTRRIRDGLADHDYRSAARAAHSLKGLAANVGANRTAAVAERIEQLAWTETSHGMAELLSRLDEEIQQLLTTWHNGGFA